MPSRTETEAMREIIKDAGMLRDEARFAMTFAAPLLFVGLCLALWHAILAFNEEPVSNAIRGALFSFPFIAMGWAACRYAAWRLEQAIAVDARRPIERRALRGISIRLAALLRRAKQLVPELAAKAAKCQQSFKLYLVGEPH
ncbi:MAG: hypothetical protein JNJ73_17375 [Hyphomonadaceae bacterium]|nr:hypothetical protein [Hyphomonadaceae bacterium]